jgi:hypothetical protein
MVGLMAGVLILGAAAQAAADDDLTRQPAGPFAGIVVRFYDTEGRAGIGPSPGGTGFSGRIGIEDGTIYTAQDVSSPNAILAAYGTPYWWETTNPWNGTIRGWSRAVPYDERPLFLFPAPASEVGFSIHREANFADRMTMGIYVSLVDKLNTPSPLISNQLSNSGRTSTVTAVYLPGNALSETMGLESHVFDEDDLAGYRPAAYWGNYAAIPFDPHQARLSTALPSGPLILAITFDGSTTAMIELEGTGGRYYEAELPIAPLPGSTLPTARELLALGEPPPFVVGPSLDAVMLRDSIDLVTDLDYHCDRNHDGVLDAADYLLYNRVVESQ